MATPKGHWLGISGVFHFIALHIVGYKRYKTLKKDSQNHRGRLYWS